MTRRPRSTLPLTRRAALFLGGLGLARLGAPPAMSADEEGRFIRIAAGGVTGTYYPVGGLIAGVVSSPPGARPCGPAGGCGVPGLIAIIQTSSGSVDNVEAIQEGRVESGFVQGDIAHDAFTAGGMFAGGPPFDRLRALASLYLESVHLVATAAADIHGVRDLKGRRISVDVEGSGTIIEARHVLDAFGLTERDFLPVHVPLGQAIGMMREGRLDALFFVAGYPAPAVGELVRDLDARLVPIAGPEIEELLRTQRFFTQDVIPGGIYPEIPTGTPTVSIPALWVVSAEVDEELVYEITRALWHPEARQVLDEGHPKGREIRLETALRGIAIPLHPGAERFYREQGMIP